MISRIEASLSSGSFEGLTGIKAAPLPQALGANRWQLIWTSLTLLWAAFVGDLGASVHAGMVVIGGGLGHRVKMGKERAVPIHPELLRRLADEYQS
jgi:hypothetical protein